MTVLVRTRRPVDLWSPFIRDFFGSDPSRGDRTPIAGWLRAESFTDGDAQVVRLEAAGIDPDRDVDIRVDQGIVTVKVERVKVERGEGTTGEAAQPGFRSEFRYGSFERSFSVPKNTTAEDISASYKDGILELRVNVAKPEVVATKVAVTRA